MAEKWTLNQDVTDPIEHGDIRSPAMGSNLPDKISSNTHLHLPLQVCVEACPTMLNGCLTDLEP